jgi:hypothetical protein
MRISFLKNALLSFFTILVFVVGAVAQTGNGSVRGTVLDPKGASVAEAAIKITNAELGITLSTKSDKDGAYQFVEVRPGTYVMTVSAAGFANYRQTGLVLLVATPTTNDVKMQLAGVATTVEVVTGTQTINTQDATIGNAFNQTQIAALPFEGRDPVGILSLQPGVAVIADRDRVNVDNDSRGGAVNGARSDQTNVTLDGVDNNDQNKGYAFQGALRATLDSIEEFRVTTTNASADVGRSSGAQVALVTKSGTNYWHGTAYEYNRPTNMVANEYFNKLSQLQNGESNTPPRLLRNTFGGSFGGPVKKDRLFFFLAYEGQRTRESRQVTHTVPSTSLRDGVIQYLCQTNPDGSLDTTNCPGGAVQGLSGASYSFAPGYKALGPTQIAQMDPNCSGNETCPWGPGVNPNTVATLSSYPQPNSDAAGDGFNYRAFTFSSPLPTKHDTYVARFDYNLTQSGTQRIFARLGLQNDHAAGEQRFPGQPASEVDTNNSKGILAGYAWTINANKVNNFHYGFIRQGLGANGASTSQYVYLRGLPTPEADSRTTSVIVPVHNFTDDFSWIRGRHTIQFGGNWRFVNNIRASDANSFSSAITNTGFLPSTGFANRQTSLDPAQFGFPAVDSGFANSYDFPMAALVGVITEVNATYIQNSKGVQFPQGAFVPRHFRENEVEFYLQDAWRIKSNLTLTYGLRYSLLQPPYEINGQQVAPNASLHDYFTRRMQEMVQGQSDQTVFSFAPGGPANGKPGFWGWDYKNLAPRLSLAWSPGYKDGLLGALFGGPGKTSIRIGAGMYYDHFGQGVVNTFDRNGSFGFVTSIADPPGTVNVDTAPRYTGLHDIPGSITPPAPAPGFPVVPPTDPNAGGFAIYWGLDDKLKTPHSYAFDFSVSRELKGGFVLEAAYVGRIGRRLLQEKDLAQPLNLYDPSSKQFYFDAATQMAKLGEANTDTSAIPVLPYFENIFPTAAGTSYQSIIDFTGGCAAPNTTGLTTLTASQAMYNIYYCGLHNETTPLFFADVFCFPGCATVNGKTVPYQFYQAQFASLFAWTTTGRSNYNALQLMLRHRASHGLTWDFNYTLSKSIDMGSDAERVSLFEGYGFGGGQVINPFSPGQFRGVSDYDMTHQINSNWIYELPFGKGKKWGASWNRGADALLGGWSFSGLGRWTSGLPFGIQNGFDFPTNWELNGLAILKGAAPSTGVFDNNGNPNAFKDPSSAAAAFRFPYPGESGSRNVLRGPGYFGIDAAVRKSWSVTERQKLSFSWEVFNVTNSVRFDAANAFPEVDITSSFGNYYNTLTRPRTMEFALRYSF